MTATDSLVFADEVVTAALVRYLDVPGVPGEIALITLDNGHDHTRPSTLRPGRPASRWPPRWTTIEAHRPARQRRSASPASRSSSPSAPTSPASALIREREQALEIAQAGHRVFRPVARAARRADLRVRQRRGARRRPGTRAALPLPDAVGRRRRDRVSRVFLGLVPGWGGTQLLPNLIGPATAVKVIVENRAEPEQDAAAGAGRRARHRRRAALRCATSWPSRCAGRPGWWPASRPWPGDRADRGAAGTGGSAAGRAVVDARLHGAARAPYRALDLIALARTADFDDRHRGRGRGAGRPDHERRAAQRAVRLRPGAASAPSDRPARRTRSLARPVTKVGVVGAGLMASQLALLFARRLQVPVVLTDLDQDRLDNGVGYVHGSSTSCWPRAGSARTRPTGSRRWSPAR